MASVRACKACRGYGIERCARRPPSAVSCRRFLLAASFASCCLVSLSRSDQLCGRRWHSFMLLRERDATPRAAVEPSGYMSTMRTSQCLGWLVTTAVRICSTCCRCPLCGGMGLVGWEGKWDHEEPCPMCLARRYVNCRSCGGLYHRSIFVHVRSKAQARHCSRGCRPLLHVDDGGWICAS